MIKYYKQGILIFPYSFSSFVLILVDFFSSVKWSLPKYRMCPWPAWAWLCRWCYKTVKSL